MLGFDGSLTRMLRTDSDGRLQVGVASLPVTKGDWLSAIPNPPNLDVALSTRASEATLVAVRDRLPISLTTLGNFKVAILEDGVGLAKSSDLANLSSLDISLTALSRFMRWGRDVSPFWVHGTEVTAPAANTNLVSRTVSSGKQGYIYGFFISAGEANDFRINWTSGGTARSIRIVFGGNGSVHYVDFIALNEGFPADSGTNITITNVNAGSSGIVYQARLLYAEV
ncbi:MAG: hypothetical protein QXN17_03685 [Nitrososphaerota archaeon]